MAGIVNDVLYGLNADFTGGNSLLASESNGLFTNGQMWIGSTAVNAGGTHINVGTFTSPNGSIIIGYSSPNITIQAGAGMAGTITGNTGGALSQTAGNWNILTSPTLSGTSLSFSGSGSTLTFLTTDGSNSVYIGTGAGKFGATSTNSVGIGVASLQNATSANQSTAVGYLTLNSNISGRQNTAIGNQCLTAGTTVITFDANTGVGASCLSAVLGKQNVGVGAQCFLNVAGAANNNIGIGFNTGSGYTTTESSNILIGNVGVTAENNTMRIGTAGTGTGQVSTCFIAGITGVTVTGATTLCSTSGQLGTVVSSIRFKENVKEIQSSILHLRPVEFNYISDEEKNKSFGFIAEEIDEQFPELCLYGEDGLPNTVKYHEMPALLLKEIQRLNDRITALEKRK